MTQTNLTQSTELLALLQQWAALEPSWCKAPDEDRVHFGVRAGKWKDDYDFTAVVDTRQEFTSSHSWHEGAALLKSVLDAIAAKGWELCLEFDRELFPNASWSAVLGKPAEERSFEACSQEPAIALLTAYLQALQAARTAA